MSVPLRTRLALRATKTQAIVAIIFVVLGFLLVLALREPDEADPLANARTEELVSVLDDVTARRAALEEQVRRLEVAQERLLAGSEGEALAEAERRANALEVLAGTTEVVGRGLRITITGVDAATAATALDAVQELRDSGAEAISVGGQRAVASTWFAPARGGVEVSGVVVPTPLIIEAIGDPDTMSTALQIPGGVAESVRASDGEIDLESVDAITIPAVEVSGTD